MELFILDESLPKNWNEKSKGLYIRNSNIQLFFISYDVIHQSLSSDQAFDITQSTSSARILQHKNFPLWRELQNFFDADSESSPNSCA